MKRWILLCLAAALALAVWLALRPGAPPEVAFAQAARGRIESVLTTNGKTEPLDWAPVVAEQAGRLKSVISEVGKPLAAGQIVAVFESGEAETEIAAAESRIAQVRAELAAAESGGRASELAQLDALLARLRTEKEVATREVASLGRLVEKQAATQAELNAARDRLSILETQLSAEGKRRQALVTSAEVEALKARLREAQASLAAARSKLEKATVRAPRGGVVFEASRRPGDWVEPGALLVKVGDLSRLKVVIYIDEPDLGKVRAGLPVAITWDAMPGREWQAVVERPPLQVMALGTRQVGEAVSLAANPKNDLPPGANVNAALRSSVVDQALTIPKAALRREQGRLGVFLLSGSKLVWRDVRTGVSSATAAEVTSGLQEGDWVAMPSDTALSEGLEVRKRASGELNPRT
jgi:HlyD family secretion protein